MRRLFGLITVAATLVVAAPSFASGATGLTEGGKLVPVGTTLKGVSLGNFVVTTPKLGNVTCQSVAITVKLVANTSSTVSAVGAGSSTASNCVVAGGGTVTVTNINITELHTFGGGTGTKSFSFELDIGSLLCKYSATKITLGYNPTETSEGSDVLTFSEVPLSVTPAACGTSSKLDGKLTMETDVAGTVPVYIM
jgi:hypothetical protein